MQTARNTSVRRSAEVCKGIVLGYARFGALLTAVLAYAVLLLTVYQFLARGVSIFCT
jgi:hypothetical protein